ncbi:MAG TPA: PAS domain-containing protein [Acidobacteriaceae bacterium]|nr:PAS domain-containing protein [Acidobacteriaceae bacterium]
MRQPLRILLLEDDPREAEMLHDSLEAEGIPCAFTRVDTQPAFLASLEKDAVDLVLAAYSQRSFDGLSALKLTMSIRPDLPVIIVSGALGEEVAINAFKLGATDYVLKTRLSRLAPSVRRALREADERAERKRAEEALRRSEAFLAQAQRLSHTGSFGWNVSSGDIHWSEETYKIFGLDRNVRPTMEFVVRRIHPDDRNAVQLAIDHAIREHIDFSVEHRLLMPDGEVKFILALARPSRPSPDTLEYVGAVMDVTTTKQSEMKLRESEAYLAEAQRLSRTGSWAWSPATGENRYWSDECFRLLGFDPADGMPPFETFVQRIHPEDQPAVAEELERATRECDDYEVDYRIYHPGGEIRHIHVVGRPVLGPSGDLIEIVGTGIDVTERKKAEEERERLRQAQADLAHANRVTTMGELTASVAHEVNQPIAASLMNARTCLRWLAGDTPNVEEAREAAMRIVQDQTRAAQIISRIRLLFKKATAPRELVDINEIIREINVHLHGEMARYLIALRMKLSTDLPQVMGDRVQLQQVMMNLMMNAIDAMADVQGIRELIIHSQHGEDGQIVVSVNDTGAGLPQELAGQLFDAFFTTKPKGTGMGLRISRSIVEAHGGRLWATDHAPRGASFTFTLPTISARK